MVRLGKESETLNERLAQLTTGYEDRITLMEQRLLSNEQSNQLVGKKGETNQGILAEVMDKMETKVLQIEQALDLVRGQADRERENVGRMELVNLKNSEEFKEAVQAM